jgi:hypothetical protein
MDNENWPSELPSIGMDGNSGVWDYIEQLLAISL